MGEASPNLDGIFGDPTPPPSPYDPCAGGDCYGACDEIFDRLMVFPKISGGTRVEWALLPTFTEPPPYEFQLQASDTGLWPGPWRYQRHIAENNEDLDQGDWVDVGLPVEDTFYAVDDVQRVYGKTQWTHYRVKLVTSSNIYFSPAYPCHGTLHQTDLHVWLHGMRMWERRFRGGRAAQKGYILKARHAGQPCPCRDRDTEETTKQHTTCYGTGFIGGYYKALPCVYAEFDPKATHDQLDPRRMRGTIDDVLVRATMLAYPQLMAGDYWASELTDIRYQIRDIQNLAEVRGVPIVINATMRPAPFSDVIYQFPVP